MIFPVVLSFDKEIAFGKTVHTHKNVAGEQWRREKVNFSTRRMRRLYTAIFVSFTFMCDGGLITPRPLE